MSEILWNTITFLNRGGEHLYPYAKDWLVQSSVLVVILFSLEWLLRKRTQAIFRYGLWLLILIKLMLPPTLSLPSGIGHWVDTPQTVETTIRFVQHRVTPRPLPQHQSPTPVIASQPEPLAHSNLTTTTTTPELHAQPLTLSGGLLLAWLTGVVVLIGLLIVKLILINRLIRSSHSPSNRLVAVLDEAKAQARYFGSAKIVLTDSIPSPAVCGQIRPVILIPATLKDMPAPNLKLAILHELIHIKRRDLWINALQSILTVIHFYNPALWIANARIRKLCEEAVDETVIALEGDIEPYSHTLINISEAVTHNANIGLRLIGVMESRKALVRRIKHMWTRPMPKQVKLSLFGLITIVTLGTLFLPMAYAEKTTTSHDSNGFHLLVLDNCDPDFQGKYTYDDRLYMLDSRGRLETVITGFNQSEANSGSHVMAVDEQRKTLWVTENVGNRLWHFDLITGKLIQRIPNIDARAIAIDPDTGNVWILISSNDKINEFHIQVISPSGEKVAKHPIPGINLDIVYSHYDKHFWIVGQNIYKFNTQGRVTSRIMNKIPWRALSVSIDQDNGDAWIVIGYHFQVQGSQPQLWHVDRNGQTIKKIIEIDDVLPFCVSVDAKNDNVWVGCRGTTLRFNTLGEKLQSSRGASGFSVAPGPIKNCVFSASDRLWISSWLDDGRIGMFPLEDINLSRSPQKWIATIPFANAKLESSEEHEPIVPPDAKEMHELAPKSLSHMNKLGLTLLMYASEHQDHFPDTFEQIHQYDVDIQWITKNVTYLGKGKDNTVEPNTLLAYDKNLASTKGYTVALFSDCHKEIIRKQEFAAYGIK